MSAMIPCARHGCWGFEVLPTQPHVHTRQVGDDLYPECDWIKAVQEADHAWQLELLDVRLDDPR